MGSTVALQSVNKKFSGELQRDWSGVFCVRSNRTMTYLASSLMRLATRFLSSAHRSLRETFLPPDRNFLGWVSTRLSVNCRKEPQINKIKQSMARHCYCNGHLKKIIALLVTG